MYENQDVNLSLTLPGHKSFLKVALSFIVNSAEVFNISKKDILKIRLASEETVTNVIKHGFKNNIEENFEIKCIFRQHQFEVIINEKGKPFDFENIEKYDPKKIAVGGDAKGLGMFLIQNLMDEVHYLNMGRQGKQTKLIKYLKNSRIDSIVDVSAQKPKPKTISYKIKDFKEKYAIGISECAYSAYGYSYESYIYYPSKIIQMNKTDKMNSYVAVDDNSQVLSHIALKYNNNPCIAEIGIAFTKNEYRGFSLFNELMKYALKKAQEEEQLKCIYGRAVTSHTISQKKLIEDDFHPSGLMLSLFPSDVEFKGISGNVKQKDAALLLVKNLHKDDKKRTVFAPIKHIEIISEIFEKLDISVELKTAKRAENENKSTQIYYNITDVLNTADLYCTDYTSQSVFEIKKSLKMLCLNGVDVVYLYLNLEDENITFITEEIGNMGFIFCGVMPFGIYGKHAVVYQYLNNLTFNFDLLKLVDGFSQRLKNYVKTEYEKSILMEV